MTDFQGVENVLRSVPSHGWVGRRDRALLVLARFAGLSYPEIAGLSTADVLVTGGVARIRTPHATVTLHSTDDTLLCGPCGLARWLHVLDMTMTYPEGCVPAAVLARAALLAGDSPHACRVRHPGELSSVLHPVDLFPAVDPWGILAAAPGARQHRPAAAAPASPWHIRPSSADQLEQRTNQLLGVGPS